MVKDIKLPCLEKSRGDHTALYSSQRRGGRGRCWALLLGANGRTGNGTELPGEGQTGHWEMFLFPKRGQALKRLPRELPTEVGGARPCLLMFKALGEYTQ